jgi:hypothetical protein
MTSHYYCINKPYCQVKKTFSSSITYSAAPVPNSERWSHEAIVARANARPERMQKLKLAANSGQNLGFDFLLSCWNDDPAKADCDQEVAGEVSAMGDCDCGWDAGEME